MPVELTFLPARLRKLRKDAGLDQTDAARMAGCTQAQISNYEVGRAFPGLEAIVKLANAYGITVSDLLGETQPKAAPPRPPNKMEMAAWVIEAIGVDGFKLDRVRRVLLENDYS